MASYHCSVKVGKVGKGAAHSSYITREGVYEPLREREASEKLIHTEHGNMPKWAADRPQTFWEEADSRERKNGSVYREFEVALPRELTRDQQIKLVREFVAAEIGLHHAYSWALHEPRAAIDGGKQPHAHIMYSERTRDEIERDPDQYFKRANAAHPERGGCRKSDRFSGGKKSAERKAAIKELRASWGEIQNRHLERAGHSARVDHRSLKDQGIERKPEKHFGPVQAKALTREEVQDLLQARAAEGRRERAQAEVDSIIDLSHDLPEASRARWKEMQEGIRRLYDQEKTKPAQEQTPEPAPALIRDPEGEKARAIAHEFGQAAAQKMRAEMKAKEDALEAAADLARQRAAADAKAKQEAERPRPLSAKEWMNASREASERASEEVEKAREAPKRQRDSGLGFDM